MDPKAIFATHAQAYVNARPPFATDFVRRLLERSGIPKHGSIADIGAGGGNLTVPLAELGFRVIAVEPGAEWKPHFENALTSRKFSKDQVKFICAAAERTTLEDGSVDAVGAGSALHWFDPPAALREFRRILKPGGALFAIARFPDPRDRNVQALHGLLMEHCPGYRAGEGSRLVGDNSVNAFPAVAQRYFDTDATPILSETHPASHAWERFLDYLSSYSSVAPWLDDTSTGRTTMQTLREYFDKYSENGQLRLAWTTMGACGAPLTVR